MRGTGGSDYDASGPMLGSPAGVPLRPLTGNSPLPSPMSSSGPQGPLAAAGVLSPVFSRGGTAGSSAGGSGRKSKGRLLASQPRGKMHQKAGLALWGRGWVLASPTPSYSAGGSAKQVLARILAGPS